MWEVRDATDQETEMRMKMTERIGTIDRRDSRMTTRIRITTTTPTKADTKMERWLIDLTREFKNCLSSLTISSFFV